VVRSATIPPELELTTKAVNLALLRAEYKGGMGVNFVVLRSETLKRGGVLIVH
jgi:hypothetical protein